MIYFVQEGATGPIKIGFTATLKSLQVRVRLMQTGNSRELRLLNVAKGAKKDEAELHRRFRRERVRGEWFSPTPELLAIIKPTSLNHLFHRPPKRATCKKEKVVIRYNQKTSTLSIFEEKQHGY